LVEMAGVALDPWMNAEAQRLEVEVGRAEAELLDVEVSVETTRVELSHFAYAHHQRLGALYARLDELDAAVAEAVALRTGDPEDIRRAREARARLEEGQEARRTAEEAEDVPGSPGEGHDSRSGGKARRRSRPTKDAQRLYRELVRRSHPDLAQDPREKARREEFIIRVNDAYANGDEDLLERLTAEWAAGPDAEPARETPDRVEWLRTRLHWLRARLIELREEQHSLEDSAIGQLWSINPTDPDGLLDQLGEQLIEQVGKYEELLQRVSGMSA
jgi:hypothetical protein